MDKEGSSSSPFDDIEYRSSVLEYISQVLMEEEDMEGKPRMLHDALALQATEKSLYEVLGEAYPPTESPCVYGSAKNLDNSSSIDVLMENDSRPSFLETQSTSNSRLPSTLRYRNALSNEEVLGSSGSELVIPNSFSQSDWTLQFNRGVQEASKFLPKFNHLSHETEDESAVSIDEKELAELSDKVLLCSVISGHSPACVCGQSSLQKRDSNMSEQKEQTIGSRGGKSRSGTKKKRDEKEVIDLSTLLILCAKALTCNDLKSFNEYLKQIRQHSSFSGDGNQRLAHFFANALEARIAGTGAQLCAAVSSKRKSAADVLKTYQLYLLGCPIRRIGIFFANYSILELVKEKKATTLHIIDFGILHGFHWPPLIMLLVRLQGGPPKLRITGIELPLNGYFLNDPVRDTRSCLVRYCERFNVPFEYNGIAKNCDTIQVEDFKLRRNEVVVVNCLYRLHNLVDDTNEVSSARDTVLNLIREINPDMFIHSVVHGSFDTPFFFLTRFRDALFHFSALFEMLDSSLSREDKSRLIVEQDVHGWKIMNVVACEGAERIERPESYKQWHVRTARAGFRQRALDHKLLNKLRDWMKDEFQKCDGFTLENDGEWMLQEWKGRILFASSVWLPA